MKKIVIAAFAALAFIGSAFAEVKLSFYNKVYEEDVIWTKGSEDKSGGILTAAGLPGKDAKTDFPALKERMFAEVKSDQVDAMGKGTLAIDDYDEKHFGFDGKVDDWYIEFRPVEILTLALHDNVSSEGSYLPIYDDNLQGGNIGSDGFTTVLRPNAFNKALRIAVTVPFEFDGYNDTDQNYINGSKDDGEDENFHIGAGFIFSLPQFEIGATLQNIPCSDHRLIGVSAAFPTLFGLNEGLNLRVGFTNSKEEAAGFDDLIEFVGVTGENVLNAALTYEKDAISLAVEAVYALDVDDGDPESYEAISFGYAVNEQLGVGVTGKVITFSDSDYSPVLEFGVNADYSVTEHSTVGVEFDFFTWGGIKDIYDGLKGIKVPVYWKWSL